MKPLNKNHPVKILYTNWKGEKRVRNIIPEKIWFGKTEWHPEEGWLLRAYDIDKKDYRDYDLSHIHKWYEENDNIQK